MACYKQLLPSVGDYLTRKAVKSTNRRHFEDEVLVRRKQAKDVEERKRAGRKGCGGMSLTNQLRSMRESEPVQASLAANSEHSALAVKLNDIYAGSLRESRCSELQVAAIRGSYRHPFSRTISKERSRVVWTRKMYGCKP